MQQDEFKIGDKVDIFAVLNWLNHPARYDLGETVEVIGLNESPTPRYKVKAKNTTFDAHPSQLDRKD